MKVRSGRSIYLNSLTFNEFKLVEFSKDLEHWVPDEQLSCSHCEEAEDDSQDQDSVLSFLVKFKATHLTDPKKIRSEGLVGYILPEGKEYDYRKEQGAPSTFKSVASNHHNLYTDSEQLQEIALKVYSDEKRQSRYSAEDVGKYLMSHYKTPEWTGLLNQGDQKNWKKHVRTLLINNFEMRYGKMERSDLKRADKLDSDQLCATLKQLNEYGCLKTKDIEEIKFALGEDALV